MPIGFWAVSRNEIKEMCQARTGTTPNSKELDRMVRLARAELEKTLDEVIEDYGISLTLAPIGKVTRTQFPPDQSGLHKL